MRIIKFPEGVARQSPTGGPGVNDWHNAWLVGEEPVHSNHPDEIFDDSEQFLLSIISQLCTGSEYTTLNQRPSSVAVKARAHSCSHSVDASVNCYNSVC